MERQITEERPTWSRIRCRRRAPETMAGLTRTARPASTTPDLDGRRTRRGPSLLESSSASSSNRGRADESAPNRARAGDDGPSPPCRWGCTSIDEASASTSMGTRSLVPLQIDASPASPLASTSASKETKQTRLSGEEGESNERVVLFFLTPGAPTAAFTCGP